MLAWSLLFLLIAAIAAFLGFGGVAVAFAGVAKIAFFVAVALLLASLLFGALPRDRVRGGARGLGILALGALIGVGAYMWMANDMSAERLGRSIDSGAVEVAAATETAAGRAANVVQQTVDQTRDEAADAIDDDHR